jgi:hypothetical protein
MKSFRSKSLNNSNTGIPSGWMAGKRRVSQSIMDWVAFLLLDVINRDSRRFVVVHGKDSVLYLNNSNMEFIVPEVGWQEPDILFNCSSLRWIRRR